MKSEKPIFYTVEELFERYNHQGRRWGEMDIARFVETDIIVGYFVKRRPIIVMVSKESYEAFLEYHNSFLLWRVNKVKENLDEVRKQSAKKE